MNIITAVEGILRYDLCRAMEVHYWDFLSYTPQMLHELYRIKFAEPSGEEGVFFFFVQPYVDFLPTWIVILLANKIVLMTVLSDGQGYYNVPVIVHTLIVQSRVIENTRIRMSS